MNELKKIVMKFGGTSVATGENIRHVANLIANHVGQGYRVVAVVSALDGVTDKLIEAAEQARQRGYFSILSFFISPLKRHGGAEKLSLP